MHLKIERENCFRKNSMKNILKIVSVAGFFKESNIYFVISCHRPLEK